MPFKDIERATEYYHRYYLAHREKKLEASRRRYAFKKREINARLRKLRTGRV
jgi:hypothetical protein